MQRREGRREAGPRRQGRAPACHRGGGCGTHLAKLARFWVTLAMRVSVPGPGEPIVSVLGFGERGRGEK